jgi:ABC-type transport system substrate-binding protein
MLEASMNPLRPTDPQWLGAYRLLGVLGEGGQGIVYLGSRPDGRQVAVKLLRTSFTTDAKARAYFAKELAAAQRVQPFCTAAILDADIAGATPYIVSEYVEGPSLREVVERHGPQSGPALDQLAVGTVNALVAIHRAGIVHRDLKPNNILLAADGPRVIDFGIARALDATFSMTSGIVGTPAYMAPEQLNGQPLTPAVDVFAWGVVMTYAANGHPAFGQDTLGVIINRILHAEPDLGRLSGPLRGVVAACLAKDPGARPTAEAVLAALRPAPAPVQRVPMNSALPPFAPPPGVSRMAVPESTGTNMRQRWWLAGAAGVAGVVLVAGGVTAAIKLGGSGSRPTASSTAVSQTSGAAFDAAVTKVVNPSSRKGGTLTMISDFDSLDPGDMYDTSSWNFSRLYARSLMTYKPAPGTPQLVPDLATGPGTPSSDLKTWTYHLRTGVKYEDGTPVTSADVKYAVARSNYSPSVLNLGPTYFSTLLTGNGYQGPYKDSNLDDFPGVTTPDDQTVVFHLTKPMAEFDYLAALPQTAPVPKAKDTQAKYTEHPVSSGPYKVDGYQPSSAVTLSRNPYWDPSTDPIRSALPDTITVKLNLPTTTSDTTLLSGQADLAINNASLQPATVAKIQADPSLRRNADNPTIGLLRFVAISTKVPPLDNQHCRAAIEYAANPATMQQAYGGQTAGDVAGHVLPPNIIGSTSSSLYPYSTARAKTELAACGKPNGFTTNIAVRSDRSTELAAATALQSSLAQIGIRAQIKQYSTTDYYSAKAGSPNFVHQNGLGLMFFGWQADYPTANGFLGALVDGRTIVSTGNTNLSELNDPKVNSLLDQENSTADPGVRSGLAAILDRTVMADAAILPIAFSKVYTYRSARVTNVTVSQVYGMYDCLSLGVASG